MAEEKRLKRAEHRGEDWPGAKVYLPPEAHRLIRLISASEGTSRSYIMMVIITNYLAGLSPEHLIERFRMLPKEPVLKAPPRRPGPPTSTVRIGHQNQQAPRKVSLSRLAAEDEQEA